MKQHFWDRDLTDLAESLYDWIVRFWKEDVWPLFMGVSFFFVLAIPLLIVLAILWYLNEIHWAPEHGRYKVGLNVPCVTCNHPTALTSVRAFKLAAHASLRD